MTSKPTPSHLSDPVGAHLREDVIDKAAADRVWAHVSDRRAARRGSFARGRSFGLALAATVLGVALWFGLRSPAPASSPTGVSPFAVLGSVPQEKTVTRLDDGSRIIREAGTKLEVSADDSGHVTVALAQGQVEFDVGYDRKVFWRVDCEFADVLLFKSHARIERNAAAVRVQVISGSVDITSPHHPAGGLRLGAGEETTIPEAPPAPSSAPTEKNDREASAVKKPETRPLTPVSPTTPTVDELLARADAARGRHDPRGARKILRTLLRDHPNGAEAGLAWFMIGRIEQEDLNQPAAAVEAFEAALTNGAPKALHEDIWARIVRLEAASGNKAAAQKAASEYLRLFPSGRRAPEIRRHAGP